MTEREIYEYLRDLTEKYPIVFHSPNYTTKCCKDGCPVCNMDLTLYKMVLEMKDEERRTTPNEEGL